MWHIPSFKFILLIVSILLIIPVLPLIHSHILDNNVQKQVKYAPNNVYALTMEPFAQVCNSATTSKVRNIMNGITIWNDHHERSNGRSSRLKHINLLRKSTTEY